MLKMAATLILGLTACGLAACGGGGGGGGSAPGPAAGPATAFSATAGVLAPAQAATSITFSMAPSTSEPALLEGHVALPAQLRVSQQGALSTNAAVLLDGDFDGDDYVVLCGDTSNASAPPLPEGALFDLRIEPTEPRTPGTYEVTFTELRAATSAGAAVPIVATSFPVTVVVE